MIHYQKKSGGGGKGGKGKKSKKKKEKQKKPLRWRKKSDCKWDQTIWKDSNKFEPGTVFTKDFQVIMQHLLEKEKNRW